MKTIHTVLFSILIIIAVPLLWASSKTSNSQQSSGGTNTKMEINKQSPIVELTAQNAQSVIENAPLLIIDFYAEWCGPCKTLKPIFEEVATELKDQYLFAKINVDTCKDIAQQYQIASLPTIAIISNGKIIDTVVGLTSKAMLLEKIDTAIKGPQDLSNLSQTDLNEKLLQAIQTAAKIENIKRLLDAGADVNYKAANGTTPLIMTIFTYGSRGIDASELITLLLSFGAQTEFIENGKTTTASELTTMMSQNLKNMAENYEKMGAILATEGLKKSDKCSGTSCKI